MPPWDGRLWIVLDWTVALFFRPDVTKVDITFTAAHAAAGGASRLPKFIVFRLLSSVPHSVFATVLYLRLRWLVPLAVAHALMDGASVVIGVLLPLRSV